MQLENIVLYPKIIDCKGQFGFWRSNDDDQKVWRDGFITHVLR